MGAHLTIGEVFREITGFAHKASLMAGVCRVPPESYLELCNALSHIAYSDPTDLGKLEIEARKAYRHVVRAVLDYYKFNIIGKFKVFSQDDVLFTKYMHVRAFEAVSIGANHKEKMRKYEELLYEIVNFVDKFHFEALGEPELIGSTDEVLLNFSVLTGLLREYFFCESLFAALSNERREGVANDVMAALCSGEKFISFMSDVIIKIKRNSLARLEGDKQLKVFEFCVAQGLSKVKIAEMFENLRESAEKTDIAYDYFLRAYALEKMAPMSRNSRCGRDMIPKE